MFRPVFLLSLAVLAAQPPILAMAQSAPEEAPRKCGWAFPVFLAEFAAEAESTGLPKAAIETWLEGARQEQSALAAAARAEVRQRSFSEIVQTVLTADLLAEVQKQAGEEAALLAAVEAKTGVHPAILLALRAEATHFGQTRPEVSTRDTLLSLAQDCRTAGTYRAEALAALDLFAKSRLALDTVGPWTGGSGPLALLPSVQAAAGTDGDNDGKIRPDLTLPDALMTAGTHLKQSGWQAGQPWLAEVVLPETFDHALSGLDRAMPVTQWAALGVAPRAGTSLQEELPAALLLPQGRKGPAFLAYPNFRLLLDWEGNVTRAVTIAYFASLTAGGEPMLKGKPDPLLPRAELQRLQRRLLDLGHDITVIDGLLGEETRSALQAEQERLGLPADGWPTREILDQL